MNRFLHIISRALIFPAIVASAASCTMIEDDVTDCPTGLYVRFVYDYNTMRADMFKDHVGHVRLYVYDEDGNKVAERSVSNSGAESPLARYGYSMHFNPGELKAGRYRLQAVALQRDWDEALTADGAKYRSSEVTHHTSLNISLDHSSTADEETGHHPVEHQSMPMDTLWHTLKVMSYEPTDGTAVPDMHTTRAPYSIYPIEDQYVTVADNRATYATVSLIRDTKHLNITLRQVDFPDEMYDRDYEVTITDDNATLAHDNSVVTGTPLLYTPYAAWTTNFGQGGLDTESRASSDAVLQRTAHFNVMFNRLMIDTDDATKGATLRIRNRVSGKTVATINLPYILAQGRTAYEYNYNPQEYLDREHDYHLNFILKGDTWQYCDVVINVLSWSKRVQNHEF